MHKYCQAILTQLTLWHPGASATQINTISRANNQPGSSTEEPLNRAGEASRREQATEQPGRLTEEEKQKSDQSRF